MDSVLELLITSGLMSALLQRELLIPHFLDLKRISEMEGALR